MTRLRREQATELAALERRLGAGLIRFAFALTRNAADAQDLAQDAMLQLSRRGGVAGIESPQAYCRRIVANRFATLAGQPKAVLVDLPPEPRLAGTERSFADDVVDRAALLSALARLPWAQQVALVLRYLEGVGDGESALVIGCSESTVRSHVARGLRGLRVAMEQLDQEVAHD